MCNEESKPVSVVFLLVLVLFGILAAVAIFKTPMVSHIAFTNHAKESHATHVNAIDYCFNNGNKSNWFLQTNGRYAQYCTDDNDKYAFWRISSCEGNQRVVITQFKQELRRLSKYIVAKNMQDASPPPCQ